MNKQTQENKMTNLKRLTKKELFIKRKRDMDRLQRLFMANLKRRMIDGDHKNHIEERISKAKVQLSIKYNNELLRRVK
jgi:hypothetical protein